jgi:hypothetical protein
MGYGRFKQNFLGPARARLKTSHALPFSSRARQGAARSGDRQGIARSSAIRKLLAQNLLFRFLALAALPSRRVALQGSEGRRRTATRSDRRSRSTASGQEKTHE